MTDLPNRGGSFVREADGTLRPAGEAPKKGGKRAGEAPVEAPVEPAVKEA